MTSRRQTADDLASEILGHPSDVNPASIRHMMRMERHISAGEPSFPHTLHLSLTIATAGVWGVFVYWPAWIMSKQRRYRRVRRTALRAAGLL